MRAVAAAVAIFAILATPHGFAAFLPGDDGSVTRPSPAERAPPSPHLFPSAGEGGRTRGPLPPAMIVEVYYYAWRDDEYIVLANPGPLPLDLSGWRITDREGTVVFPAASVLGAGGRAVVARNATSYFEDTLDVPAYTYGAGNATAMLVAGRTPQLNNDGDEVLLIDSAGTLVDAFVYGTSTYTGGGWTGRPASKVPQGKRAVRASLADGRRDTDTAADWDSLRSYGLGQSDLPFERFHASGTAVAFLSPDDSLAVLKDYIDHATTSIHAGLYTLTNRALLESLRASASRGVDVRLILEGAPVGGIDAREWSAVKDLTAAGASIRFLADDAARGVIARYRFLHAKYAIIDSRIVIVGSENWGDHGFPPPGRTGNRGWQIAISDASLGSYFERLFRDDFDPGRRDSVGPADFSPAVFTSNESASNATYEFALPSARFAGPFTVTPVIAPDHALRPDALFGLIESAANRLDIEAFYIAQSWGAIPNPYLEAAMDAARRGVSVRILLDGTWYNTEGDDPIDNDDTVSYVNRIARQERLPLEARIGTAERHGLAKFHNKGVLVDDRVAFVSSLNWNRNAATNNREVGLIVDGAAIVEPFRLAFESDWDSEIRPRHGGASAEEFIANPLTLPLLTLLAVNVALVWARVRNRRRGRKGLSEEDPSE